MADTKPTTQWVLGIVISALGIGFLFLLNLILLLRGEVSEIKGELRGLLHNYKTVKAELKTTRAAAFVATESSEKTPEDWAAAIKAYQSNPEVQAKWARVYDLVKDQTGASGGATEIPAANR